MDAKNNKSHSFKKQKRNERRMDAWEGKKR